MTMNFLKKTILHTMIAAILVSASATSAFAEGPGTVTLSESSFSAAGVFSCGMIPVMVEGKWGYADENGEVTIAPKFDYAANFYEGKALVGTRSNSGGLDLFRLSLDGNLKNLRFSLPEEVLLPKEEQRMDHGWFSGYLSLPGALFDSQGEPVDTVTDHGIISGLFSDGLFSSAGYDASGNPVIYFLNEAKHPVLSFPCEVPDGKNGDFTFSEVYEFYEGYAAAWVKNGGGTLFGLVDREGKLAFTRNFDTVATMSPMGSQGACALSSGCIVGRQAETGKWGAVAVDGSVCVPFEYEEMMCFSEGLAPAKKEGLWGYVDTSGTRVIPCDFTEVTPFQNGIALGKKDDTLYTIDKQGKTAQLPDSFQPENLAGLVPRQVMAVNEKNGTTLVALTTQPGLPRSSEMAPWAYHEVCRSIEAGLVPAGLQFAFRENIRRDDFAQLVIETLRATIAKTGSSRLDNLPADAELYEKNPFRDTWHPDVILANRLGIINGISETEFAPKQFLKRQEAAALLMRMAGLLIETDAQGAVEFEDSEYIADYAKAAVNFVTDRGIMNGVGDNRFDPHGPYTKEQAAMTMLRLYEVLTKEETEEIAQEEEKSETEVNGNETDGTV